MKTTLGKRELRQAAIAKLAALKEPEDFADRNVFWDFAKTYNTQLGDLESLRNYFDSRWGREASEKWARFKIVYKRLCGDTN